MADSVPRHYFEASVYIALIKREEIDGHARWWHCLRLLEETEAGTAVAVTSAITIAEVTSGKGKRPQPDIVDQIEAFFRSDDLLLVGVDRVVAEHARDFIWAHSLNQVDAIHLASAILARCDVLYTYDRELLRCHGKVSIGVEEPVWHGASTAVPHRGGEG